MYPIHVTVECGKTAHVLYVSLLRQMAYWKTFGGNFLLSRGGNWFAMEMEISIAMEMEMEIGLLWKWKFFAIIWWKLVCYHVHKHFLWIA